ncbi:MAG: DUF4124 domain-containing protein [Pseudomonadales bacterium]|nr:DUF4124 domain-containing protein [Pseudomonadales bacterium]
MDLFLSPLRHSSMLFLVILFFFPTVSVAAIYRWVDDNGNVLFSDKKPEQKLAAKEMDYALKNAPSIDEEVLRQRQLMREHHQERQQRQAELNQEKKERAQQNRKRCRKARKKMDRDKQAGTYYSYNKDGSRHVWSNDERLAYQAGLNKKVKRYCH